MQPGSVLPLQLGLVLLGACGSIGLVQALAQRDHPGSRAARVACRGWCWSALLAVAALWIFAQPMDMRGVGRFGMSGALHCRCSSWRSLVVPRRRSRAHDGPPFPIVSDRVPGAYLVSVWTDPDATDDGSPGGQFWVQLQLAGAEAARAGRDARDASRAAGGAHGAERVGAAEPVRGDVSNQFAAVVMDHEGRFAVDVTIDGPPGPATVTAEVDATYDLRPPPFMLAVYALPFVLAGFLWIRLLDKKKGSRLRATGYRPF